MLMPEACLSNPNLKKTKKSQRLHFPGSHAAKVRNLSPGPSCHWRTLVENHGGSTGHNKRPCKPLLALFPLALSSLSTSLHLEAAVQPAPLSSADPPGEDCSSEPDKSRRHTVTTPHRPVCHQPHQSAEGSCCFSSAALREPTDPLNAVPQN